MCTVPTSVSRRQAWIRDRRRTLQPQTQPRLRSRVGSVLSVAAPFRRSARHDRTACSITTIVSRAATPSHEHLGITLTSRLCRIPPGRQGTRALSTRCVGRKCSQSATSTCRRSAPCRGRKGGAHSAAGKGDDRNPISVSVENTCGACALGSWVAVGDGGGWAVDGPYLSGANMKYVVRHSSVAVDARYELGYS